MFNHDGVLQEIFNIIIFEGGFDRLIAACDYYHYDMHSAEQAFEFAFNFGEYVGKYRYGEPVFKFSHQNITFYFIGTKEEVKVRLDKIL